MNLKKNQKSTNEYIIKRKNLRSRLTTDQKHTESNVVGWKKRSDKNHQKIEKKGKQMKNRKPELRNMEAQQFPNRKNKINLYLDTLRNQQNIRNNQVKNLHYKQREKSG